MQRGSDWAVAHGFQRTTALARELWNDRDTDGWKRWAVSLGIGIVALTALAVAVTLYGKSAAPDGLDAWDRRWLEIFLAAEPLSFQAAIWWEAYGSSAVLLPVSLGAALLALWLRRPLIALSLAGAYILHKPVVMLAWSLWDRARPDLVAGGIAAPSLHSYPSGHMVQTVAIYGLLAFLWMRTSESRAEKIVAALVATFVCIIVAVARLRLGVHWPSDILAGSAIGIAWLATLVVALRRGAPAEIRHRAPRPIPAAARTSEA